MRAPLAERLWAKVEKTDSCWIWTASVNENGYGRIGLGSRDQGVGLAHRVAYEICVGPLVPEDTLDHRCRNRRCVNPDHLQPVDAMLNGQNRDGSNRNSRTGIRNVHWDRQRGKYQVRMRAFGRRYHGGFFDDIGVAAARAVDLRNEVMTNNLADRETAA